MAPLFERRDARAARVAGAGVTAMDEQPPRWRRYLRFWGPNVGADVDDELRFHLDMRARDYEARGMSPAAARLAAVERFGNVSRVEHALREHDEQKIRQRHRREFVSDLVQDIRLAVRGLRRTPGFAIVVIATLALCIGANSAIFSVVNAVLLRPLPYRDPDALVRIYHVWEGKKQVMSPPNFIDVAKASHSLIDASAVSPETFNLIGAGEPVRVNGAATSASFFRTFGATPVLGRAFQADENEPGHTKVVVLSHALWQQRFGSSAAVIGTPIDLDGVRYTIVGVMGPAFDFPRKTQLWTPLVYDERFTMKSRGAWYIGAVARLKPGVSEGEAAAEVQTIGKRLEQQYPDDNGKLGMTVGSMREALVGDVRKPLVILLGAVGFVLLIACANVANLVLARSTTRQTEMAVRSALGAGRGRLVRQLLTESVLLAVAGGALGLLLAIWGVRALGALQPKGIPRLDTVSIDGSVMAFTAGIALLTGIVFGIAPAMQLVSRGGGLALSLRAGSRAMLSSWGGRRLRGALIVAEIALALVLLTCAGLMMQSFVRLQRVDPGFHTEQRLAIDMSAPRATYSTDDKLRGFYESLIERLGALPGTKSIGAISGLPLSNTGFVFTFTVVGRPPLKPEDQPSMQTRVITSDYHRTLGIPIVRGRTIAPSDRPGTPVVAVINQSAARQFFPGEDPIGKRIEMGWIALSEPVNGTIVGVAGDVKGFGLDQEARPEVDFSMTQLPLPSMSIVLRTDLATASLVAAARREVRALDATLPIADVRPLEQMVADSVSQPRFYMVLLGLFAGVALLLAAVGIGGMMSFAVAQRTREIGVRVALGASRGGVISLVVGEAMRLAAAGVVIGALAAAALSRAMASLLFGIGPRDPLTFAFAAVLLAGVALAATLLPARRAASVDPAIALRAD
ncbi:MAG: ABC transporter permease [Gemmatimonadaceae bacterium]